MDGDMAQAIVYDVAAGRPIKDSKVKYDAAARKFREAVEAEWEEYQKEHPDAVLTVPAELPDAGIKVPKAVAKPKAVKESTVTGADWLAMAAAGHPVPSTIAERDFDAATRKRMAKHHTAMPDGSFPIAAKDPDAAKRHIVKRARALGLTAKLPDDWGIRESFTLTEADRLALRAAGHPVALVEKKGDDHFYGAWKGGSKSSGGGPASETAKGGSFSDKDGGADEIKLGAGNAKGPDFLDQGAFSHAKVGDHVQAIIAPKLEVGGSAVKLHGTVKEIKGERMGKAITIDAGKSGTYTVTRGEGGNMVGFVAGRPGGVSVNAGRGKNPIKPPPRAPRLPATSPFMQGRGERVHTAKSRGGPGFDRNSRWLKSGEKPWQPSELTPTGRLRRSKWTESDGAPDPLYERLKGQED
jgi:hypothetical protein